MHSDNQDFNVNKEIFMAGKKTLIIVCGGGFSREVIWLARECRDEWNVIGVLDDTPALQGTKLSDVPVLGTIDEWQLFNDAFFVVALGSPRYRKAIVKRMESKGRVPFGTLIHPAVNYSSYVSIAEGCIITAGCILTTQISLGRHCICNLSSTVGHDVTFGDYVTVAPQVAISGNVTLGAGAEVGTGAVIIERLTVGGGSFVGAGAVVTKTVPENILVVGAPARQLKTLDPFI
jgi:sugar O-acyltransferase (sialic acid O-acetyltransferase NeuD family)